jgi:hypothetical protein
VLIIGWRAAKPHAVKLLEGTEPREGFDRARTELLYGECLRRHRRRADARHRLQTALEQFAQIGARPWEARARSELRASGEMRSGRVALLAVGRCLGRAAPLTLRAPITAVHDGTSDVVASAKARLGSAPSAVGCLGDHPIRLCQNPRFGGGRLPALPPSTHFNASSDTSGSPALSR